MQLVLIDHEGRVLEEVKPTPEPIEPEPLWLLAARAAEAQSTNTKRD